MTVPPTGEHVLSAIRGLHALLGGICLLLAVSVTAVLALRPPAPKPQSAPAEEFSAERAAVVLRRLLADGSPHAVGSAENRAFRSRLEQELRGLSLVPRVVAGMSCGTFGSCAHVENVIAELPAKQRGRGLGIAVHYDSVPASAGAADDGAGVASALEVARALLSKGPLERPVSLIFTDGEEAGLLGANLLAQEGSLLERLELVLNLEARGVRGPSLMFQTTPGNLALVRAYAASAERAVTSSLFGAVYEMLPNDTDLSVFVRGGAQGLNFAFIEGARHYHTPSDDLSHLSLASVQHLGDQALALSRVFQRHGPPVQSSDDAVFFDLLGRGVVVYPRSAAPLLLGASAGTLVLVLAWASRRRAVQLTRVAGALIVWLLALGPVLLWAVLLELLLAGSIARDQPWPDNAWLLLVAVHAGAFAAQLVVSAAMGASVDERTAFFAELLGTLLISAVLTLALPEAQFLGLVPLVARLTLAVLALAFRTRVRFAAASLCAIIPVAAVVAPIDSLTYHALGFASPSVTVCVAALLTLPLFPLLPLVPARTRGLASASFAGLAGLSLAVWSSLPTYSSRAPARVNIAHHTDADTGKASWMLDAPRLPPAMAAIAAFQQVRPPPGVRLGGGTLFAARAQSTGPLPPEVVLTREQPDVDGRRVALRIATPPGTSRLSLALPASAAQVFVAGQRIGPISASEWEVFVVASPPAALELRASALKSDTIRGWLVQEHAGLPSAGRPLARARDQGGTPSQNGDVSIVSRSFSF